jgi:DNA invertase Pin-like site-specific DNA recombinase
LRCAIYTRKSTEEGLDQEFNSLDAQREAAEAFIQSQRREGWIALPELYDDGGFTGGNMDRPALGRLLDAVEAGELDCVVVYKVDRLSRSLLDFTRMLSIFEKHQVSFVAVTQQFNTSTSLGRLTLNILLSFAQFERELIGERTRDKMSAARRKGKWVGGCPVLGYDVDPGGAPGQRPCRDRCRRACRKRRLQMPPAPGRRTDADHGASWGILPGWRLHRSRLEGSFRLLRLALSCCHDACCLSLLL